MSVPVALLKRNRLPMRRRVLPLLAVGIAKVLARNRPSRIRAVLEFARRGARPATMTQALAARDAVISVSLSCAGRGCLQRSIGAALLCRAWGVWPTWGTGVRTDPFSAHAWIEVDNQPVGEPNPSGYYRPILTVAPLSDQSE